MLRRSKPERLVMILGYSMFEIEVAGRACHGVIRGDAKP